VRAPKDWPIARPGDLVEFDLVEFDTLDVRQLSTLVLKQFTAWDRASRWDVVEPGRRATVTAAAEVLDALAARMPFKVRAISVDNGAEFMAEFEQACATRGIRLFVLPPRSPKLHGTVERANRTHTAEFYELTDAETGLASLQAASATGRPSTTPSVPTNPSATSPPPSTWHPWGSMCNGGCRTSTCACQGV